MQSKSCILLLITSFLCGTVAAQSNDVIKDVTTESLINALAPKSEAMSATNESEPSAEESPAADGTKRPIRTRQFKMVRDKPAAGAAHRPAVAARPSASLMITFESGSARLTQFSRKILDMLAQALGSEKLATSRFSVEGHADPTGFADQNLRLSEERAIAVREYLSNARGIDANRLSAVGKGSSDLLNRANPTAPENRRVRIVNISQ